MPQVDFIRIKHLGTVGSTLYLQDLDTPENRLQGRGVPVYIAPGEKLDIPLLDRVADSYRKGTIKGFLDMGLLSAYLIDSSEDHAPQYEEIAYDAGGRVTSIMVWSSSTKEKLLESETFTYNSLDRVETSTTTKYDVNGVIVRVVLCTYTYQESTGQIASITCEES